MIIEILSEIWQNLEDVLLKFWRNLEKNLKMCRENFAYIS